MLVSDRRFKQSKENCLTLEDGSGRSSRNVGNNPPIYAANITDKRMSLTYLLHAQVTAAAAAYTQIQDAAE